MRRRPNSRASSSVAHGGADRRGDRGAVAEQRRRTGHVEERLVERQRLDDRGEPIEDLAHVPADRRVQLVVAREEHGVRASSPGDARRHRRAHPVPPCLVRGRGDHAPVARSRRRRPVGRRGRGGGAVRPTRRRHPCRRAGSSVGAPRQERRRAGSRRAGRRRCHRPSLADTIPRMGPEPAHDERALSALPSVGVRVAAFAAILVSGLAGALIGYSLIDLQCEGACGVPDRDRAAGRGADRVDRDGGGGRAGDAGPRRVARDRGPHERRPRTAMTDDRDDDAADSTDRPPRPHRRSSGARRTPRPSGRHAGARRPAATRHRPDRRPRHQVDRHRPGDRVRQRRRGADRRRVASCIAPTTRSSVRRARTTPGTSGARMAPRSDRRHRQLRLRPAHVVHVGRGGRRATVAWPVRSTCPSLDEMFSAARGRGGDAQRRARSACRRCRRSTWPSSAPASATHRERREARARGVAAMLPEVRDIRRFGSAAIDLCLVACGRLDAYFEQYLNSWDTAAGVLIASEAGATTSDFGGGAPSNDGVVVAAPAHPRRAAGADRRAADDRWSLTDAPIDRACARQSPGGSGIMGVWVHASWPSKTTSASARR